MDPFELKRGMERITLEILVGVFGLFLDVLGQTTVSLTKPLSRAGLHG